MQLTERTLDNVNIIAINGRFDAHTSKPVSDWLEAHSSLTPPRIVINFENTEFIDSVALAVLVSTMKRCRQNNGDVFLAAMSQPVKIIFELTRLNKAFHIFDSEVEALVSFGV